MKGNIIVIKVNLLILYFVLFTGVEIHSVQHTAMPKLTAVHMTIRVKGEESLNRTIQ